MFNAKPSCQPTQQTPIEHPIAHRRRLPHRTSNLEVLKAEIERLRAQVELLQRMIAEMKRERSEISLTASSLAETSQRDSRISEKLPDGEQRDSPETSRRASTVPRTVRPASTDRSDMKKRLTGDGRRSSAEGQRDLSSHVVHIGGYGSLRFEANNIDLGTPLGTLPRVRRGFHSFDFRRFVLTTDITPADRLRIHSEIEFERLGKIEIERTAIPENRGQRHRSGTRFIQGIEGQSGSEIKIEQAWLQYDIASDQFGLRAGIVLPPLGRFNLLHDDDYWDIPRRTLVDRDAPVLPAETAWSELGAGILGTIPLSGGFIKYQAYIVNGVTLDFTNEVIASLRQGRNLLEIEPEIFFDSGPVNGSNTADAATWRLALSPRIGSEIAFSGYHGRYTPDYLNVRENINSFGIDGKLTLGSFEAEGEFIYTDYGRMQRVLDDLARQLVDVGAETSGDETEELESEAEAEFKGPLTNQRYGFWIDLKYRWRPRWLRESFLGRGFEDPQLIPIVRYERVWFNDLVRELRFADGIITNLTLEDISQDRLTIGLTYRPIPSIPISLAYEHNHRRKGRVLVYPDILGSGRLSDRSFDTILFGIAFGF
ncbi:MAG: hypothetical protein D6723_02230 [Acidobacteria bacterium]|nr:MAG: hypothetical protein D6723_02230 [Acidobacteriota bacterium]